VVGVVQARTQSTRLPGKVLLPIEGRPMLERMLARLVRARSLDELVVATTCLEVDRPITAVAAGMGLRWVAGHPTDLIERHAEAARLAAADVVVKIPSDCPLVDPAIVDQVVGVFRGGAGRFDYVSNLHPASWPDGNDVEVFRVDALQLADRLADLPHEREHTTPFLWDQPERFRLGNVIWGEGRDLSASHRLTVDHREDFEVVSAVWAALAPGHGDAFSVGDIVAFLDANPGLRAHNGHHRNTGWPADHAALLRTRGDAHPPAPVVTTTGVTTVRVAT
jgi:spore coat polysaccharide biosynthesis protein SpsF